MRQFAKNFITAWRQLKLPLDGQTVVAAVSGGADSVSLAMVLHELLAAHKLHLKIIVAHFNHRLRGAESDADAEFVRELSLQLGFSFFTQTPECSLKEQGDNLEQAARRARYRFLLELALQQNAFAVLTAHTLNDQAETFLLRLLRGSGADGLGAMTSLRLFDAETRRRGDAESYNSDLQELDKTETSFTENVSALPRPRVPTSPTLLIRPLLNWATREQTENYCQKLDINFRRDTMNDDERFARVRVRKQLIPFLKTFNPQIIESLSNTAALLREDAQYLNDLAEDFLRGHQFLLLTDECSRLAPALRRRVLRIWLEHQRGDLRKIDTAHLRAIESLILKNVGNRIIELPDKTFVTRRGKQLIYAVKVEKNKFDN